MPVQMNLRHARLFCASLSCDSITQAAEAVGITQPAASQALARLDAVFGATLLDLTGGRPVATAAGRLVQNRLNRASDLIRSGCARLRPAAVRAETIISTSQLNAISAFAEASGFSAAARLLGQSQPAVYKMARSLEDVLGTRLFDGAGKSVRLTDAGMSVARWARLALNEIESALSEVRELQGDPAGRITLGTLPLPRTSLVPEVVARVVAKRPSARISIVEGRYGDLLSDLEMGRIDMLIGALRPDFASATLQQQPLFSYALSVVARAGHPLSGTKNLSIAQLADFPWIVARPGTPSLANFERLVVQFPKDRPAQRSVEVGSLVAIRGILMKTDHLALLSDHQVSLELQTGLLTELDFDFDGQTHMVGVTTRKHWLPTRLDAEFLNVLQDCAANIEDG